MNSPQWQTDGFIVHSYSSARYEVRIYESGMWELWDNTNFDQPLRVVVHDDGWHHGASYDGARKSIRAWLGSQPTYHWEQESQA